MSNGLYLQPFPTRVRDDSLPVAPDQGEDVTALIGLLSKRIDEATRKIEHKVDSNALAKIILTDKDLVFMGDQVNIVGQLNVVDWIRDISGNITGGIDARSMTRITGGKIQTGVIESFNWSVMTGSQIDLDNGTIVLGGTASPKFYVNSSGQLLCQDATITGTLTAGSFIQGAVKINDEFGISIEDLAAGTDIQAALDAGVTNILAGIGSDFRLNVNVDDALITLQHKDAVLLGTAAAGSNKPGLGITASGIAMGYNRSSDGAWQTRIAMDTSGNLTVAGTLTAGSIIAGSVTVLGTRMDDLIDLATAGYNINIALTSAGTTILKGVLVPTDAGALKVGTITWNSTTGALTGGTGIAITEWGIIGANAGTATFSIQASTGAAIFRGNITGGSNLDITGTGSFNGATTTPDGDSAIYANGSRNQDIGINARDGSAGGIAGKFISSAASSQGIYAIANGNASVGIVGQANAGTNSGGIGIQAIAFGDATALVASSFGTGPALEVNGAADISGLMQCDSLRIDKTPTTGSATATFPGNNKPGSTTSCQWLEVNLNGVIWDFPAWRRS